MQFYISNRNNATKKLKNNMTDARNNPEKYPLESDSRMFSHSQEVFIERMEKESAITEHLESLNCSEIEVLGTEIIFEFDGQQLNVFIGTYPIGCDINTVLKKAQKYTCCGDLIDYYGDSDICPTCKEHC